MKLFVLMLPFKIKDWKRFVFHFALCRTEGDSGILVQLSTFLFSVDEMRNNVEHI